MSNSIYVATYSNVDVYECVIDGIPLMRRVSDDWVNATQILKAGKFPKAHRTRILDKETQSCVHEKIQGGYGRFQGTWVPLGVARPFAHRYNVTDAMAPILTYNEELHGVLERKSKGKPSLSGGNTVPDQNSGSPVKKPRKVYNTKKRRAAAAALLEQKDDKDGNSTTANISFQSSSIWEQDTSQSFNQEQHQQQNQQILTQHTISQHLPLQQHQQQIPHHLQHKNSFYQQQPQQQKLPQQLQFNQQVSQYHAENQPYQQHRSRGSNENWSQDEASTHMGDSDTSISSEHSIGNSDSKPSTKPSYTEALIHFFSNESDEIPAALLNPPRDYDFNDPIDEEGHTALHWASSMASTGLIDLLLKNGADPLAPNYVGLNAVSRSIFFNNSYQKKNFHLIIDLMKPCSYTPDKNGRTPLHYVCESNSSKSHISLYYLENLLDRLSSDNRNLLKMVVDHKDSNGLTAADLAERTHNGELLKALRAFKASIENKFEGIDQDATEAQDLALNDQTEDLEEDEDDHKQENSSGLLDVLPTPTVPSLPLTEVGPILTSMLGSLADAYDNELKTKEEEGHHTVSVLERLRVDISVTEKQNNAILNQLDIGSTFEELEANVNDLEDICNKKTAHLHKIIERSQALGLAKLVLKEESSIQGIDPQLNQLELAAELTRLQLKRNKMLENIINEFSTQNINTKMNNFRRLISISCGLKMESIDELIDEIEADLFTTVT